MLLCCIGCAIFGITEVSTDGIHFDASADFAYTNAEEGTAAPGTAAPVAAPSSNVAATSTVFVPPPPPPPTILTDQTTSDSAPDVTIDSPAVPIVMAEVENDATIFPVVNENHQAETMAVATDATRANPDDGATTLDSLPPGEIQGLD